jgi:hypothetical protein
MKNSARRIADDWFQERPGNDLTAVQLEAGEAADRPSFAALAAIDPFRKEARIKHEMAAF